MMNQRFVPRVSEGCEALRVRHLAPPVGPEIAYQERCSWPQKVPSRLIEVPVVRLERSLPEPAVSIAPLWCRGGSVARSETSGWRWRPAAGLPASHTSESISRDCLFGPILRWRALCRLRTHLRTWNPGGRRNPCHDGKKIRTAGARNPGNDRHGCVQGEGAVPRAESASGAELENRISCKSVDDSWTPNCRVLDTHLLWRIPRLKFSNGGKGKMRSCVRLFRMDGGVIGCRLCDNGVNRAPYVAGCCSSIPPEPTVVFPACTVGMLHGAD